MLKKFSLAGLLLVSPFLLSSCSSLVESTRKSLLGSETPRKKSKEVKWVSKAQYDGLMERYKNLSDKYEKLKDESLQSSQSAYDQVDELAKQTPTETVDVFAKNGLADQAAKSAPTPVPVPKPAPKGKLNNDEVSQELQYYKKAMALKENGKIDEALKIFQYLERSPTDQVRVRARAQIGDIYMLKGQYDLALQVYETMITNDAFSGKILTALKKAVVCCDRLNLTQKKLKYQSILEDFFEIEG